MIAKHVPAKGGSKSSFAKLVKYMIAPLSKYERVGTVTVTNCHSDCVTDAMLEVLNTQAQNIRSKADKTYHLIVSFRSGDLPDAVVLQAVEKRICAVLGFADHQRISAVHHDTDHLHVHIAINKVHPTRHTMNEPFNAYFKLGQICAKLEAEFAIERDNHTATKLHGESLAKDMERNTNVESLLGWVQRECSERMHGAETWAELHQLLSENGLEIRERGNGLVILSDSGFTVKASSVGREFSKSSLERRLGVFVRPVDDQVSRSTSKGYSKRPKPAGVDTIELFARYTTHQQQAGSRTDAWSQAVSRKKWLIEDAKRTARLKRAVIKSMTRSALVKKILYKATSKTLQTAIREINNNYRYERQEIYKKFQRRSWTDWLQTEAMRGDEEALRVLRARPILGAMKGNTLHGPANRGERSCKVHKDSVTKSGTIIYIAGNCAIRDDGHRLLISRGSDPAGLAAALQMAAARYGRLISVNGTTTFKGQIAAAAASANLDICFDDKALELRRQQLVVISTRKGKPDGHYSNSKSEQTDRRRVGGSGRAAACASARSRARAGPGAIHAVSGKSHFGKIGQAPPPESRNGMRELSEFGLVHVTQGSEVLLPGHVPDHMEHEGSQSDYELRRNSGRSRLLEPSDASHAPECGKPNIARVGAAPPPESRDRLRALSGLTTMVIGIPDKGSPIPASDVLRPTISPAGKYVFEREQKRLNGFDIPKHSEYSFLKGGVFSYAGIRVVEGQALVLLRHEDEINVLEIDKATASKLKRKSLGQQLSVSATGAVTAKGRGR